jgi:hypothetical protein
MLAEITLAQWITLVVALVGAVLGIINTWQNLSKSRVKLRVLPKRAIPVGGADPRFTFCIEITNLSDFAVTIEEAGVFYEGTNCRGAIVQPVFADGGSSWPRRLESRSSLTVYSQMPTSTRGYPIKSAYARTQDGYTKTGTSPALKQIASAGL